MNKVTERNDAKLIIEKRLQKLMDKIEKDRKKSITPSIKRKLTEDMYYVMGMWAAFSSPVQFVEVVKDLENKYGV